MTTFMTYRIVALFTVAALALSACGTQEEGENKADIEYPTYTQIWKGLNGVWIEVPVYDDLGEKIIRYQMMKVKSIQMLRSGNSQDFMVTFLGIGNDKYRLTIPARSTISFDSGRFRIESRFSHPRWEAPVSLEQELQENLHTLRMEAGDNI